MVNPDVVGYAKTINHQKIIRKTQKQQPTENQTNTETQISLKVAVRFSHLDCQDLRLCPPSVTSLAIIYCFCIQQAVPTLLQQDTSWRRSLVCGRACELSN